MRERPELRREARCGRGVSRRRGPVAHALLFVVGAVVGMTGCGAGDPPPLIPDDPWIARDDPFLRYGGRHGAPGADPNLPFGEPLDRRVTGAGSCTMTWTNRVELPVATYEATSTYDEAGRIARSVIRYETGDVYRLNYQRDEAGRLLIRERLVDQSERREHYAYDEAGRLTNLDLYESSREPFFTKFHYDEHGRVSRITRELIGGRILQHHIVSYAEEAGTPGIWRTQRADINQNGRVEDEEIIASTRFVVQGNSGRIVGERVAVYGTRREDGPVGMSTTTFRRDAHGRLERLYRGEVPDDALTDETRSPTLSIRRDRHGRVLQITDRRCAALPLTFELVREAAGALRVVNIREQEQDATGEPGEEGAGRWLVGVRLEGDACHLDLDALLTWGQLMQQVHPDRC